MKQVLCTLIFIISVFPSFSQKIIIQFGYSFSKITNSNTDNFVEKNTDLGGLHAGILTDFTLNTNLKLETGLIYQVNASKTLTTKKPEGAYVQGSFKSTYIQIPLNVIYSIPLNDGLSLSFNAGPYVGFGTKGKSTYKVHSGSVMTFTGSKDVEYSNGNSVRPWQENEGYYQLKKLDYGLHFGTGLITKDATVKIMYGLGLSKITAFKSDLKPGDNNKFRNLIIALAIPISLNKKK